MFTTLIQLNWTHKWTCSGPEKSVCFRKVSTYERFMQCLLYVARTALLRFCLHRFPPWGLAPRCSLAKVQLYCHSDSRSHIESIQEWLEYSNIILLILAFFREVYANCQINRITLKGKNYLVQSK